MDRVVKAYEKQGYLHTVSKIPRTSYLNKIMRANCFPELHALFKYANSPAKEFTESYSAFHNMRRSFDSGLPWQVIHIGDGAHARTAAMFAHLARNSINISIDPDLHWSRVKAWQDRFGVKRFVPIKGRAEDVIPKLGLYEGRPTMVTFVHAHVNVDNILSMIPGWNVAFTMACCQPRHQLSSSTSVVEEGQDWNVLSEERDYQILVN